MTGKNSNTLNPFAIAAAKKSAVGAGSSSVRTPWGVFDATRSDEDTRDPFEPEDPIPNNWQIGTARSASPSAAATPAMTPRALYEMLMTPAARPTRASPVRSSGEFAETPSADPKLYPAQADLVLSALEAGQSGPVKHDRRTKPRKAYRVRAILRLYSDQPGTPPWVLFTRDVHSRGIGFITQQRLPLGYGGAVELPDPQGGNTPLRINGTLLRCREAAPGWFEGSLYFNREQPEFSV